jgi:hypothetical protein
MSTEPTVWHGRGDTFHATRSCAGATAVPVFEEFLGEGSLSPCGVCEPGERYFCDHCGYVSMKGGMVRTHILKEHEGKTGDAERGQSREAVQRARELREKSRRGGEQ